MIMDTPDVLSSSSRIVALGEYIMNTLPYKTIPLCFRFFPSLLTWNQLSPFLIRLVLAGIFLTGASLDRYKHKCWRKGTKPSLASILFFASSFLIGLWDTTCSHTALTSTCALEDRQEGERKSPPHKRPQLLRHHSRARDLSFS